MFLPMRPIFMPERARALSADWAPGPGVLVLKKNKKQMKWQTPHTFCTRTNSLAQL